MKKSLLTKLSFKSINSRIKKLRQSVKTACMYIVDELVLTSTITGAEDFKVVNLVHKTGGNLYYYKLYYNYKIKGVQYSSHKVIKIVDAEMLYKWHKELKQLMLQKWLHKIELEICRLDQVKYSKFTKLKVVIKWDETHILYTAEGKLYSTGDREIQVAKFPNLVTLTNKYFECKAKKYLSQ